MSENVKISDLVELGTLEDADELPVVDTSANATKRVTYQTLSSAVLNDIDDLAELSSLAADDVLPVVDADANATKRVTYDTLATEVRSESEPLSATTVTASGDVSADTATIAGDITSNGETVYHRGNVVGTVSESGGDVTGAVIERDENGNGEYVKFADGTLITSSTINSVTVTSGPSGGYYFARKLNNYSASFVTRPNFVLMPSTQSFSPNDVTRINWFHERNQDSLPTTLAQNTFISTVSGDEIDYYIIAIGRWY